jgi:hypothetical protein
MESLEATPLERFPICFLQRHDKYPDAARAIDAFKAERKGQQQQQRRRQRALYIGIRYNDGNPLKGTHNDVTVMRDVAEALGIATTATTDVRYLLDDKKYVGRTGPPNRANILLGFEWLLEGALPGDDFFLFYSGHGGFYGPGRECLVPSDYLASGNIGEAEIFDLLVRRVPAGARLTMVLDCCHSGDMARLRYKWEKEPGGGGTAGGRMCMRVDVPDVPGDVVMVSACKAEQTAMDLDTVDGFEHPFGAALETDEPGGACTNAIGVIVAQAIVDRVHLTFAGVMEGMTATLRALGCGQAPQLTASRNVDPCAPFALTGALLSSPPVSVQHVVSRI